MILRSPGSPAEEPFGRQFDPLTPSVPPTALHRLTCSISNWVEGAFAFPPQRPLRNTETILTPVNNWMKWKMQWRKRKTCMREHKIYRQNPTPDKSRARTKGKEALGKAASRRCGWSQRERLHGMLTGREKNFSPQQIVIPEEFGIRQSKQ